MDGPTSPATLADARALPSGRKRRLFRWGFLLLVFLSGAWWIYYYFLSDHGLSKVVAETDRIDPGWRLEELEAARARVPDVENSANLVAKAGSLLPKNWQG